MEILLTVSRAIDAINKRVGRAVIWLVLVAVLISAVNAVVRKAFNISSNAFLEIQWYLFSAIFLLGAAYTLQRNEHVRIDVLTGHLSSRAHAWIDIFGTLLFLMPMAGIILWLSWDVFLVSYRSGEVSASAGGLTFWPARLLVPVGFLLLMLQGLSELFKRIAFLAGRGPDPAARQHERSAEEELAEEIRRMAADKEQGK